MDVAPHHPSLVFDPIEVSDTTSRICLSNDSEKSVVLACIGVHVGQNITEYVIVQVGCTGKTIIDMVTSSPIGLLKSNLVNQSTGLFISSVLHNTKLICCFQASIKLL